MSNVVVAGIVGFLAHQLIFIHGEWHLLAPTVVTTHVVAIVLYFGLEIQRGRNGNESASTVFAALTSYLLALYASIGVYRVYFHRLNKFPGPRLASVSKLWHVWQCRDSRNHLVLERLRQEYGPFVRTGKSLPLGPTSHCTEDSPRPE